MSSPSGDLPGLKEVAETLARSAGEIILEHFGGMLASTVLAVLFVPVFYVIFQRLSEFRIKKPKAEQKSPQKAVEKTLQKDPA